MKPQSLISLLLVLAIGIAGFRYARHFLKVDHCLDHGGRWDYKCDCCEQGNPSLTGTSWVSKSEYFANDTLKFISMTGVEYFLGELEWIFDSKYEQSKDTLTILTKTYSFETNTSSLPTDLRQTYLVIQDSLILLKIEIRKDESWEPANSARIDQINNFVRIK